MANAGPTATYRETRTDVPSFVPTRQRHVAVTCAPAGARRERSGRHRTCTDRQMTSDTAARDACVGRES